MIRALICLALALAGCDDGGGAAAQMGADADPPAADATVDAAPEDDAAGDPPDATPGRDCDDSQPPLVMAHGLLASGDTWSQHHKRFTANGHCPERYLAFDWNTLNMAGDHVGDLDAFIDAARARFQVEQVDLMGHSAGGGLSYRYLADAARAAKVRRYVHVGSTAEDAPPGPAEAPVDALNLWSEGDLVLQGADIPGAENAQIPELDHYAVATDAAAFAALYAFLYDGPPGRVDAPPTDPIIVSGRAQVLGENTPEVDGIVEIWPVGAEDGLRSSDSPAASFIVDADGGFGPFTAAPGQHYELWLQPARQSPPVRYYREPFTRTDPLVYLRTLPEPPGLAGTLLRQIPFDDAHSVLVIFNASRAVIAGRDSLLIDGTEVATEALAAAADTTIAFFLYDVGVDGVGSADGAPVATFAGFPFLSGLDLVIPADAGMSSRIELNGRTLHVPRWPSASEGAIIATFE